MSYHKLLNRQVKKHLKGLDTDSDEFNSFLKVISETYSSLEKEKSMAERAFEVSEKEYFEVNKRLKKELDDKKQSVDSLNEAVKTISNLEEDHLFEEDIVGLAHRINDEVKQRKSAESVFTSLISNLKNGILLEDEHRKVRFVNQMFCDYFQTGVGPDEIQGQDCSQAAEQFKNLFKEPQRFVDSIDVCLKDQELVLGEVFEMADGTVLLRDYIPIFTDNQYKGHLWSYTDITESRKHEKAIAESELKNRLIMNAALDAIITIDINGKINFWNPQAEKIFGWTKEEVLGKSLSETIIPQVHREGHSKGMKKYNETGHGPVLNQQMQLPAVNKNGEELSIELYILPIGMGEEKFFCSFIRDITERKKIEAERERLSLVASANENGIVFVNDEVKIVWSNEGFKTMTGYSEEEITKGNPYELLVGPKTKKEDVFSGLEAFKKRESISKDVVIYKKNGEPFWIRLKGQNLSSDNKISSYFFMIEDISDEKEVQDRLKEYDEKLRNALNSVGDNYWEHDFSTDKTVFLSPGEEFLGFAPDEISEDKADFWWSRVHPEDYKILESLDSEYKSKKRTRHNREYRIIRKDGSIQWVIDRGVVLDFDENGNPLKIIGTHIDITEQKKMEEELLIAKEQAESSTRAKEMFLANMSHEIRTPMNAILGMANQMGKTPLTENQKFYLSTINSATENLLVIINDILDLSKIDAGELSIEKIGFEPSKVIGKVMQVMSFKAEEKGLSFTNSICDPLISKVLIGDPYRMNQILLNLTSNAIKFTEKGTVDIQCHVLEDQPKSQVLECRVVDTGVGMSKEFSENLFQKFKQEDDSVTRKFGGTGLGMSIVKELVNLMGGEISVNSSKGKGTEVVFTVTMDKGTYEDLPQDELKTSNFDVLQDKKILLADDNEMNRLVASTILENYGAEIIEAKDGLEAVYFVQKYKPDLVLMDVQMPNMDGLAATRLIRKEISKELPVVALTALALKGEEVKFKEAGMDDYVLKPFKEERLLQVISQFFDKEESPEEINEVHEEPVVEQQVEVEETESGFEKEGPKLYDLSKLEALAGGNEAFVKKMVDLFVKMTPETLDEMKLAYTEGDYVKVGKLAHKMKPSLDNMGIDSLKELIKDIEVNASNLGKSEELEAKMSQVESTVTIVLSQIEA
ncbi:PAS domain S-box protein [Jiulongibacter sp. NS-SX5]|uniref:PAS domain S-box protein n=1 Tax=Jiulongibacter sp. NS-SX5 TaxID=3463854 RepID=UPI004058C5CE